LNAIVDFAQAVAKTKRSKSTEIDLTSSGKFQIVSFSPYRIIGVQVLSVTRMAILMLLAWMGTVFIVHTETIVDLIINSLALQAVLNVDSLMFKALVPVDAASLATRLQPLPLRTRKCLCSFDLRSVLALLALPTALATAYVGLISPRVTRMEEARHILCGGNREFLISTDGLGIPHASVFNPSLTLVTREYRTRAIQQVIDGVREGKSDSMVLWATSSAKMQTIGRSTIAEAVYNVQGDLCLDLAQAGAMNMRSGFYQKILTAHVPQNVSSSPITSCSQVAHLCWDVSRGDLLNLVRLVCPRTCGCTDPRGGVLFVWEKDYCAPGCVQTAEFAFQHGNLECTDMPPDKLRQEVWWTRNAKRLQWFQEHQTNYSALSVQSMVLQLGCDVVRLAQTPAIQALVPQGFQSCDDFSESVRRFWRSACPGACNCTLNFRAGCPPKCDPSLHE